MRDFLQKIFQFSETKTVDHVILFDDGCEKATSLEQWYVSISRARKSVRVFTQDTTSLEQRITKSFNQKELLKNHWQPLQYPIFSYKNALNNLFKPSSITKTKDKSKNLAQARLF